VIATSDLRSSRARAMLRRQRGEAIEPRELSVVDEGVSSKLNRPRDERWGVCAVRR